ncbi:MAG TPA: glutathione S-transferase family protein [Casimicrobiaceae bacterium]|jgi:glutathione S-transferase|nr:glutathione S-transferase family protein [Casimicrobiaceae bacterium]
MSLRIYGLPASRTFRCLWAAEEAGLAYENVPWSTKGPEIKDAAYLAINPNGTIPALADDGFNLFESLAINFYLARKSGRLLPADARGEALVLQWTLWAATECEPHIGNWYYHTQMLPPAERKPEVAADAAARLPRRLQILDDALAGRDHLVGGDFTLADLNVAAVLFRAPQFGLDAYPNVKAWHARCLARPAAQRAIAMREAKAPA